jgi:DNA-binding transcriptional MerR regulator
MSRFTDNNGREWKLSIDVYTVEQVHKETGVSIHTLLDDKFESLGAVVDNTPVLAHVCYVLADANDAGVSHKAFAKAIKGDSIEGMKRAFLEELAFFFPDERRRQAIRKILAVVERALEKGLQQATKDLESKTTEELADAVLTSLSLPTSTNLPAISESTPAP